MELSLETRKKLEEAQNIWFASVRRDGRPHLAPIWFIWQGEKLYVCTDPTSVKIRNISANDQVVLALEDGLHPVICEGRARIVPPPYPDTIIARFLEKYEWDITNEKQYSQLVEIVPTKWLVW